MTSRNTRFSSIVTNPTLGITIPTTVVNPSSLGTSSTIPKDILMNKALYEVGDLLVGWLRIDSNGVIEAIGTAATALAYNSSMVPTSGTGLAISRSGMYILKANTTMFSVAAGTGNVFFGGTLSGSAAIIGGTTIGQVSQDASAALETASIAIGAANTKMDNSSEYVMQGTFALMTADFDIGDGVAITSNGFIGKKDNVNTFSIDTLGNAVFAGTLSAATGTFAGSVTVGTGGLVIATSATTFTTILSASSTSGTGISIAQSGSDITIYGTSTNFRVESSGNMILQTGISGTVNLVSAVNGIAVTGNMRLGVYNVTANSFVGVATTASNVTSVSHGTMTGNYIYEEIDARVKKGVAYTYTGDNGGTPISGSITIT